MGLSCRVGHIVYLFMLLSCRIIYFHIVCNCFQSTVVWPVALDNLTSLIYIHKRFSFSFLLFYLEFHLPSDLCAFCFSMEDAHTPSKCSASFHSI